MMAISVYTDVNECYLGTHQCQDHCENTWGSYICGCLERGMRLDSDRRSCVCEFFVNCIQ